MAQVNLKEVVREFYVDLLKNPNKKVIKRIFDRVYDRFSKDSAYRVCVPSVDEIIFGIRDEEYASEECASIAAHTAFVVMLEYREWALQKAIKYTLIAYKLAQSI